VVDAKHHLIIAHEVTNIGHDRCQLANMARQAREVTGAGGLTVLADRGYFSGEEVVACEAAGVTPIVPKPLTSGADLDDFPAGAGIERACAERRTWQHRRICQHFDPQRHGSSNRRGNSSDDPVPKKLHLFNVEQIEGLPAQYLAIAEPRLDPVQRITSAETSFAGTEPTSAMAATWPITISARISCRCRRSRPSAMPKGITRLWRMNAPIMPNGGLFREALEERGFESAWAPARRSARSDK
jgi:hypothetical protein